MDPSVFLSEVRDPRLVAELFQLSRPWKDETLRRPLYPPIPPSTFITDLKNLFSVGVDCMGWDRTGDFYEDHAMEDLKGDCRLVVQCIQGEEVFMAHKCILVARSDFFEAALLRDWSNEKKQSLVSLQHISQPVTRDAMLAFLYFLYTASTSRVNTANAFDVMEILGPGSPTTNEPYGFLQVHGGYELWQAAEEAAGCIDKLDDAVRALTTSERVGSTLLRERAIEICIHYFDEFNTNYMKADAKNGVYDTTGARIPSGVLFDICSKAFSEFGSYLPPPATNESWEVVTSSPSDVSDLEPSELKSLDLSCGCSVKASPGTSEAYIQLVFKRNVRVRLCRIGIDLMQGDWDADNLNGARLQYCVSPGKWIDAGVTIKVENGVVREFRLPKAIISQYFRLVRHHCLCVGMLVLE